jgi:hypothetical protein
VQPIQDLVTIGPIDVDVAATGPVKAVTLVPEGEKLAYTEDNGRVRFTVANLTGHRMIEIAYQSRAR